MNSLFFSRLRSNWRLVGAVSAFLVFTFIHFVLFRPAAARYRRALDSVGGIEAVFNAGTTRPMLPPRLFSVITEHSLTPQDAADRGGSGALGVVLLEDLGRVAGRAGLAVDASEPGAVAQQANSVQIRAHLKLHGRYAEIVSFFDELGRDRSLILVDRFKITPVENGDDLEIWVSRLYLKHSSPVATR